MRAILFIITMAISYLCYSQTPTPVKDKYTLSVRKPKYIGERDFKPVWYFNLFHRKYKRTDHRNAWPLGTSVFATTQNETQAEDELEYRTKMANQDLMDGLDRTVNLTWTLVYKNRIDEQIERWYTVYYSLDTIVNNGIVEIEYVASLCPPGQLLLLNPLAIKQTVEKAKLEFVKERSEIEDYVKAIRLSYIPESKKREAYNNAEKKFQELNKKIVDFRSYVKRAYKVQIYELKNQIGQIKYN